MISANIINSCWDREHFSPTLSDIQISAVNLTTAKNLGMTRLKQLWHKFNSWVPLNHSITLKLVQVKLQSRKHWKYGIYFCFTWGLEEQSPYCSTQISFSRCWSRTLHERHDLFVNLFPLHLLLLLIYRFFCLSQSVKTILFVIFWDWFEFSSFPHWKCPQIGAWNTCSI